jgi:hypothetical protein
MKRVISLLVLVSVLAVQALAGDIQMPGIVTPPRCTENCDTSSQSSMTSIISVFLITYVAPRY